MNYLIIPTIRDDIFYVRIERPNGTNYTISLCTDCLMKRTGGRRHKIVAQFMQDEKYRVCANCLAASQAYIAFAKHVLKEHSK